MAVNDKEKTVLIVDDNPENIDILRNILESSYRLRVALNGQKALDIAASEPQPDIILLDIMMPDMSGYEVCRKLRQNSETSRIPVIFITALSDSDDEEYGLSVGAVDYITKPISIPIVLARVRSHLKLKEYSDHLEQRVQDELEKLRDKNEILIQQSKLAAIGKIIDDIAHQWRQPLNSLSMLIQNFKFLHLAGQLTGEEIDASVKEGISITNYMSKTIDDFRDFFSQNRKITDFTAQEMIDQTISIVGMILRNKQIELVIDVKDDIELIGVKNELGQVLLNIINNASEALETNETGEKFILISAESSSEGNLLLRVTDNAGGIIEANIDKIFDARFTTKAKTKGSGVGLYMAKVIIEDLQNGSISAKNINIDYKGKTYTGAQFELHIPIGGE